ncbi:hypothetical protein KFE25_008641 [Diacronema lutheri]|uniref:Nop domain-containing protein n=2 Tax=Diacronema lutheri TaxID=2081491 RepID=A0A8J5XYF7_DIALT|nr:hypothetical protein KFE25_008641 [Diacronema lutheri]
MLVLFETPGGLALFNVLDEAKIRNVDDLWRSFETQSQAQKIISLNKFVKFEDSVEAVAAAASMVECKVGKTLKKLLKKAEGETLGVADAKLGAAIKEKLSINCICDSSINELLRGIRAHAESFLDVGSSLKSMQLGLAHGLSRYKLKFSPDKVDTMIVQAIGLLDDLDKELNTYAMRLKEWYGWHFPEMMKIVPDNLMYARTVQRMGMRTSAKATDLSAVLPEELEAEVKESAEISMGTEISEHDLDNILMLCEQVVELGEYRAQLFSYLKNRMAAIAPNLTVMVGELVGARLIAHAGSLLNLAKHPASTVQILGAEKALFRALKTKHDTPKYGLIYHASLVGQAQPKHKGKISRILAAKCSLSVRVDALSDSDQVTIGIESRHKVEERIRQLEGRPLLGDARAAAARAKPTDVYYPPAVPAATYNPLGDSADVGKKPKKDKADKKGRKDANGAEGGEAKKKKRDADGDEDGEAKKKKKKDK